MKKLFVGMALVTLCFCGKIQPLDLSEIRGSLPVIKESISDFKDDINNLRDVTQKFIKSMENTRKKISKKDIEKIINPISTAIGGWEDDLPKALKQFRLATKNIRVLIKGVDTPLLIGSLNDVILVLGDIISKATSIIGPVVPKKIKVSLSNINEHMKKVADEVNNIRREMKTNKQLQRLVGFVK